MDITFEDMVNEAYQQLDSDSRGDTLILPEPVTIIDATRLHWKNVKDYLRVIRRHPDHFMSFLKKEIPGKEINWFSGSKADGLIVHGKRQKNNEVTELSLKYVDTYVICPSCKHADTRLVKENSKNYQFECLDCGMKKFM